MKARKITYPQYRKYSNGKAYFKVLSTAKFEEIQLIGNSKTIRLFEVNILPDRNYIHDLTFNYSKHWLICEQSEYESIKAEIQLNK